MIEELDAHLREGAAAHGEPEAVRRMGDARAVAESFTPRAADRLFEQRDRLAALLMLAAMAASLPLARTLEQLGRPDPSHAWAWFFAFLAPTAAVALVSCLAVLRRRPLGARLAAPLLAMVAVTAAVVLLDLPPVTRRVPQLPGGRDRPDAPAVHGLRSRLRRQRPRLRDPHQLLAGRAGAVRLLPVGRHRLDAAPARQAAAAIA